MNSRFNLLKQKLPSLINNACIQHQPSLFSSFYGIINTLMSNNSSVLRGARQLVRAQGRGISASFTAHFQIGRAGRIFYIFRKFQRGCAQNRLNLSNLSDLFDFGKKVYLPPTLLPRYVDGAPQEGS